MPWESFLILYIYIYIYIYTESHSSPPLPSPPLPDPAQPKNEWSLTEGFVVEEGKDLLPPKYGGRTNLMDCFHALMLAVLMNEELFEVHVRKK